MDVHQTLIEKSQVNIHTLKTTKVEIKNDNENRKNLMKEMTKINKNHDELRN